MQHEERLGDHPDACAEGQPAGQEAATDPGRKEGDLLGTATQTGRV